MYVFKFNQHDLDTFAIADHGNHIYLGKSEFGAKVQGCIEIEMSPTSHLFTDATWTEVLPLP